MNSIGAIYTEGEGTVFTVWAPFANTMTLHLVHPTGRKLEMKKDSWGYFSVLAIEAQPGTRYFYMPDSKQDLPDPASHYQPEGVHGPSEVVNHSAYRWQDSNWRSLPFQDLVLYELHVGTFTPHGTFEAIIPRLDELADTGINAIEIMPVAQFPGSRNWGYDGVFPYAVQNSYGGPEGLKKLIDACHAKGIAVFLDVVYNHLGPEGNYLPQFGPYFTRHYTTPWGEAINYDGEYADGVREYFSNNALYWFEYYHIDGLRCDAIHTIYDYGAVHFWELTHKKVQDLQQRLGRSLYLIAESDLNSPRVIKQPELGGYGFNAQWLDDFHHSLYVLLDKKGKERYIDFGSLQQLAKAYSDGFVHTGEYVRFRKRKYGASSSGIPGNRFVAFIQNHDQIGNQVGGERMALQVSFEQLKQAAAALLLSPYIPMLFMGEEYAEDSRFYYFVSHGDKELVKAVQEGRKKEFEHLMLDQEPPDPQSEQTFNESKLKWERRTQGRHQIMLQWHKQLIHLRRTHPVCSNFNKSDISAYALGTSVLALHRQSSDGQQRLVCLFNFSVQTAGFTLPTDADKWLKLLDSKEQRWMDNKENISNLLEAEAGAGTRVELLPHSASVYEASAGPQVSE